jgi:hypothetical protein
VNRVAEFADSVRRRLGDRSQQDQVLHILCAVDRGVVEFADYVRRRPGVRSHQDQVLHILSAVERVAGFADFVRRRLGDTEATRMKFFTFCAP